MWRRDYWSIDSAERKSTSKQRFPLPSVLGQKYYVRDLRGTPLKKFRTMPKKAAWISLSSELILTNRLIPSLLSTCRQDLCWSREATWPCRFGRKRQESSASSSSSSSLSSSSSSSNEQEDRAEFHEEHLDSLQKEKTVIRLLLASMLPIRIIISIKVYKTMPISADASETVNFSVDSGQVGKYKVVAADEPCLSKTTTLRHKKRRLGKNSALN